MNQTLHLPLVRRWRLFATATAVAALAGGGVIFAAPSSDPGTATAYHTVVPIRVLDTRDASSTPLGVNATRDFVISGLPTDATAVSLNVTVTDGTEASFLVVYPTADARPSTSIVNWNSAGAVANSVTVVIHSDDSLRLYNLKGSVNVVIDLLGYYAPSPVGAGETGAPGADGVDGTIGLTGPPGGQGVIGLTGLTGGQGVIGLTGPAGADSTVAGPIGATGPAGATGFGYIFNIGSQTVALEADVTFDSNGPMSAGITRPTTAGIAVADAGTYSINFSVSAAEPSQFAVFVNGVAAVGALYGSGSSLQQNNGQVIVTLSANSVITLRNHTSAAPVNLQTLVGGTQVYTNASILIERLT